MGVPIVPEHECGSDYHPRPGRANPLASSLRCPSSSMVLPEWLYSYDTKPESGDPNPRGHLAIVSPRVGDSRLSVLLERNGSIMKAPKVVCEHVVGELGSMFLVRRVFFVFEARG